MVWRAVLCHSLFTSAPSWLPSAWAMAPGPPSARLTDLLSAPLMQGSLALPLKPPARDHLRDFHRRQLQREARELRQRRAAYWYLFNPWVFAVLMAGVAAAMWLQHRRLGGLQGVKTEVEFLHAPSGEAVVVRTLDTGLAFTLRCVWLGLGGSAGPAPNEQPSEGGTASVPNPQAAPNGRRVTATRRRTTGPHLTPTPWSCPGCGGRRDHINLGPDLIRYQM